MKKIQRGFTLIELVIVIVLVGILAAVAIPKFVDLKTDAALAATKGVAAALASASAINYAANQVNATVTLISTCTASGLLNGDALPSTISFVASTYPSCTLHNSDGGADQTYLMTKAP